MKEQTSPHKPQWSESPHLAFSQDGIQFADDPQVERDFHAAHACLTNLTNYLIEFDLIEELEPQIIKDELDHFNGHAAHEQQHAAEESFEVSPHNLAALSLRRLIAGLEAGATTEELALFARMHAVIALASAEEKTIEQMMQPAPPPPKTESHKSD